MHLIKLLSFSAMTLAIASGCKSDSDSSNPTSPPPTVPASKTVNNISISQVSKTLPQELNIASNAGFNLYVSVTPSGTATRQLRSSGINDGAIHIIAYFDESKYPDTIEKERHRTIVNYKIERATKILQHLMSNVPNSQYGENKSSIAALMAQREATLIMTENDEQNQMMLTKLFVGEAFRQNKIDDWVSKVPSASSILDTTSEFNFLNSLIPLASSDEDLFDNIITSILTGVQQSPNSPKWLINSQSLMFRELTLEGDCHYMSNFANYCENLGKHADRDAGFEEILHLFQAQGIAPNPTFYAFQQQIQQRALSLYTDHKNGHYSPWQPTNSSWQDWKNDDIDPAIGPSYSHEYFAAAFEAYMGMWEHKSKGLDSYQAVTRSQMRSIDTESAFWIENMFHDYLQYTANIDSNGVKTYYNHRFPQGGLTPTFNMSKSTHPPLESYTFKSRWLVNAKIIGDATINLNANDQNNHIEGNKKDNVVDGKGGDDVYIIDEDFANCVITEQKYAVAVQCSNTGTDTLANFEAIQFKDRTYSLVQ
ncbi:hypothetical protein ACWX0P_25300 [Vibrio mediterranei]|uniref:hypothetical protein n=1 Tax=Vibrio mediterranei TaxID=689 RepID=UPI0001542D62|nr:hypothetical protein [Vibrio mediterranei]EDL52400.1 putative lipoprotein [Vibrio mediterranei AK1]